MLLVSLTFSAVPIDIPRLVTTRDRVYRSGDDIDVLYRSAGDSRIRIERIGDHGGAKPVAEKLATGSGSLHFDAALFDTGHYTVTMQDGTLLEAMQRELWVLDRNAIPQVEVIGSTFSAGEGIEIRWMNAPGNRNDYVALVRTDGVPAEEFDLPWAYVTAQPHGQLTLDASTAEWGWPPPPGQYVVRLLKDDGYEQLAESAAIRIN